MTIEEMPKSGICLLCECELKVTNSSRYSVLCILCSEAYRSIGEDARLIVNILLKRIQKLEAKK